LIIIVSRRGSVCQAILRNQVLASWYDQSLTFGSLFAGIGGMDLGLERAGMECRWQVEIDPFCQKVLAKHWPQVKRYGDIRTIQGTELEPVDLICGGFPCQDVSFAGQRVGIDGPRSGLWRDFGRILRELRPQWALIENVSGLLDRGIERVFGDLAEIGFDAEWTVLSACTFGAPHPRERLFVLAYPAGGQQGQLRRLWCPPESLSQRNLHWAEAEPKCERMVDGIARRLDRLRGCGNAVVPQVAEWIGRRIIAANQETSR
jgi:DNA (cytosine-5)-methyltransferase 1